MAIKKIVGNKRLLIAICNLSERKFRPSAAETTITKPETFEVHFKLRKFQTLQTTCAAQKRLSSCSDRTRLAAAAQQPIPAKPKWEGIKGLLAESPRAN